MSDRATFLKRVREAIGRQPDDPLPSPPPIDPKLVRRVSNEEGTVERFLGAVEAVGGKAVRAPAEVLPPTIAAELVSRGISLATIDRVPMEWGIGEACARAGVEVVSPRLVAGHEIEVRAGITTVTVGIAETGTIVIDTAPDAPRSTSLLPEVHIAIGPESRIVADTIDALELQGALPSSRVWITGPSKTADIEGILVTGVHGPREWIVAVAEGV